MRPDYFIIAVNKSQVEFATFSCVFLWILLYLRGEYSCEVIPMKTRTWIVLIAVVLTVCLGISIWFFLPREDAATAKIISNGKVAHIVDLSVNREITVDTGDGGRNIVTVRDGKIAVTEANCPDHYCMDRGFCSSGSPIVCLPNRLVIEFQGELEVDFVAG